MITPVRRSLRFHEDYNYSANKVDTKETSTENDLNQQNEIKDGKKDLVFNLLKEHEFAYMPNQVHCIN